MPTQDVCPFRIAEQERLHVLLIVFNPDPFRHRLISDRHLPDRHLPDRVGTSGSDDRARIAAAATDATRPDTYAISIGPPVPYTRPSLPEHHDTPSVPHWPVRSPPRP